jgi:hypothetical protein
MLSAACGGMRKATGPKLTNRHSRTKAQQALGSMHICTAKKVISQMPGIGISEQASSLRKVRCRRNGSKLLARCSNPREDFCRGDQPLRNQHNLSEHGALFHVFMSGAGVFERKGAVYDRLQFPAEDVFQHFVQLAHRAHIRAEDR